MVIWTAYWSPELPKNPNYYLLVILSDHLSHLVVTGDSLMIHQLRYCYHDCYVLLLLMKLSALVLPTLNWQIIYFVCTWTVDSRGLNMLRVWVWILPNRTPFICCIVPYRFYNLLTPALPRSLSLCYLPHALLLLHYLSFLLLRINCHCHRRFPHLPLYSSLNEFQCLFIMFVQFVNSLKPWLHMLYTIGHRVQQPKWLLQVIGTEIESDIHGMYVSWHCCAI